MAPAQNFFHSRFICFRFGWPMPLIVDRIWLRSWFFGNLTVFDRLYLRAQWDFFNNFLCFEKLRPSSRRYADLRGSFVYFCTPPRDIPTITKRKIHFPTPNTYPIWTESTVHRNDITQSEQSQHSSEWHFQCEFERPSLRFLQAFFQCSRHLFQKSARCARRHLFSVLRCARARANGYMQISLVLP